PQKLKPVEERYAGQARLRAVVEADPKHGDERKQQKQMNGPQPSPFGFRLCHAPPLWCGCIMLSFESGASVTEFPQRSAESTSAALCRPDSVLVGSGNGACHANSACGSSRRDCDVCLVDNRACGDTACHDGRQSSQQRTVCDGRGPHRSRRQVGFLSLSL